MFKVWVLEFIVLGFRVWGSGLWTSALGLTQLSRESPSCATLSLRPWGTEPRHWRTTWNKTMESDMVSGIL